MSDLLRITGAAWGPRCNCPDHPRAHYHGSAFLLQEAHDGENATDDRLCNGCEADRKAAS